MQALPHLGEEDLLYLDRMVVERLNRKQHQRAKVEVSPTT